MAVAAAGNADGPLVLPFVLRQLQLTLLMLLILVESTREFIRGAQLQRLDEGLLLLVGLAGIPDLKSRIGLGAPDVGHRRDRL